MRTAGPRHHHGICGVSELVLLERTFWNAWLSRSRLPGSHILVCHTLKQFRVNGNLPLRQVSDYC